MTTFVGTNGGYFRKRHCPLRRSEGGEQGGGALTGLPYLEETFSLDRQLAFRGSNRPRRQESDLIPGFRRCCGLRWTASQPGACCKTFLNTSHEEASNRGEAPQARREK
jgi:hypothetical protein